MTTSLSRRNIDFLLHEWLDVTTLTKRDRFAEHSRDTFDAIVDLSNDIAAKRFAPLLQDGDRTEPTVGPDGKVILVPGINEALQAFSDAGLMAATFDDSLGGMQLPTVVSEAALLFFRAANPGFVSYASLTMANANLLTAHGTPDQIDTWVRPMLEGRFFGTMCLSEPDAGSSLTDITTKAVKADDGSYRILGTKMWITAGDHELSDNIVHLVLAKVPGGPTGVKGISLFIVPKFLTDGTRNDVALVGLNHKMGNHAATNTLLNFGDGTFSPSETAGAIGYLVGREHHGLSYMFHMMNESRISVGLQAAATGSAAHLTSVDYAKQRIQGRPVDEKQPTRPAVPIIAHADVKRMLLAQKAYSEGAIALGLYCARLVDEINTAATQEVKDEAHLLLEVLTPITKSWPSQWCLEANNLAIQIHGGYGYTTEFTVEQGWRDNRLNAIHEGAHGIHGIDLLGRKVTMQDGAGLRLLLSRIRASAGIAAAHAELAACASQLDRAAEQLAATTATVLTAPDRATRLANASLYLEAAGHLVIAWMWLEQLIAIGDNNGDFYDGKRSAAAYFFTYELPKISVQLDILATLDETTLATRPEWF
ncbi:acyl-CoA dehydrogenase [Mycolicibacterium sp. 018/SC-01/001]|uniref:acyl-CoA dehydrogenase n=1 Tax=Mycolicibacterium sp. 018/SC-01/001 TaxID=2592069 RepID=UPI00117DDA7B|nr:acyl-CoA dehydrogenase [Mycolicibacterium sp. 018/SC-01/001]TRW80984.1 acyl-CoA dehydrogenase [Mycolicibacterium sp. 018/SC-01/001]